MRTAAYTHAEIESLRLNCIDAIKQQHFFQQAIGRLAVDLMRRISEVSVLMMQAYIRLKLLTGMARGDLLRLEPDVHFKDDGIHITRHKTGKSTIYEWNDALREAVALATSGRSSAQSKLLFCTRDGIGYIDEVKETASGWDSMWQRFMIRIMAETNLAERFTEHDLRAKCASDAESLEHARALLSHVDSRVTDRIYRRKPERVKPGKLGFE